MEQEIKKEFFDQASVHCSIQQEVSFNKIKLISLLKLTNHYKEAEDSNEKSDEEYLTTIEAKCKSLNINSDTYHNEMIEYYQVQRPGLDPVIPLFFKNLRNNQIYFKKVHLSMAHATAMKNILIEASHKDKYP